MNKTNPNILINIIQKPIITDKTTKFLENNQYCFKVDRKSNKTYIKEAIEYLFNVKVIKINTCYVSKKKRTVGRFHGYKKSYKKAIVTLSTNDKIDLFTEE